MFDDIDFDDKRFSADIVEGFLRQYEFEHGYTKAEVARKIGWTPQAYGEIKRRQRISGFRVRQISNALNVPIDKIISDSNSEVTAILSKYPFEILKWLASDDGKNAIIHQYESFLRQNADNIIKSRINKVSDELNSVQSLSNND